MFQYVLALLLINTYYQSLGNPILPNAGNHSISQSLLALAKDCKNKFLAEQILNKTKDCDFSVPPYEEHKFQCLMFYDVNIQLCSAFAASKLSLNEDYSAKINEQQDVNTFCMSIKDFVFSNLTEYEKYKVLAQKIFSMPATCGKACGYSDIANQDVNFYCKYYKWGLDMLKSQASTAPSGITGNITIAVPESDGSNADISVPINPSNSHAVDTKTSNLQSQPGPEVQATLEKIDQPSGSSVPNLENRVQTNEQVPETNKSDDADPNSINNLEDPTIQLPKQVPSSTEQIMKPIVGKDSKLQPLDGNQVPETVIAVGAGNVEQKEPVIETPANKKPLEDIEYPGSEEDKIDGQGDDEDDTLGDINEHEQLKEKIPVEKNTFDVSQKEYYPHTEPEEYTEDSDNFFPFFLTVVIMVVVLYILYHNKNKVSKLFFGLILEGRQNSRRRNSRGHSYRRLDTLEQAMSANTAAPPSKIIY